MTTTEAPATNPHQPVKGDHFLRCAVEDCNFSQYIHSIRSLPEDKTEAFWRELFHRHHSSQYDPGRAPDITVDWEISACCSVCPDGVGDVVTNDSEGVICQECKTTWHIDGTGGELDQPEQELADDFARNDHS